MMTESTKSIESLLIKKVRENLGGTTEGIITLETQGQFASISDHGGECHQKSVYACSNARLRFIDKAALHPALLI